MLGTLQPERYGLLMDQLRSMRVQVGVTQETLAERLGKPQSFVSKTERCERRLDVAEFIDWSLALGLEPEEMLSAIRDAAGASTRRSAINPK